MDAAISGLIGAIIGGLITIIVSCMNNKKDFALRQLEYKTQSTEAQRLEKIKLHERQLERYSNFLGAYRQVHGYIIDIIQLLRNRQDGWQDIIRDIIDSREFTDSVTRLNDGAAWIGLICHEEDAGEYASKLSTAHDELFVELVNAKNKALKEQDISFNKIEAKQREVEDLLNKLTKILRKDIIII